MIVLDTNVLSELMRPTPTAVVTDWLEAQPPQSLYATSLSFAEMLFGAALLPRGKRRDEIQKRVSIMFTSRFDGRVLAFEPDAASAYAVIASTRQQAGRPIGPIDAMIAAIASTHRAVIATRDRDFSGCGVEVINPWEAA